MPRGNLNPAAARQQIGLAAAQEFFTWMYRDFQRDEQCEALFWVWFFGLGHRELAPYDEAALKHLQAAGEQWEWRRLQKDLRRIVEQQLAGLGSGSGPAIGLPAYQLIAVTGEDGRTYLRWAPGLPLEAAGAAARRRFKPGDRVLDLLTQLEGGLMAVFSLDVVFRALDGTVAETIGRCAVCQHYFVRQREKIRQYCSPHCAWRAAAVRRSRKRKDATGREGGSEARAQRRRPAERAAAPADAPASG